MSYDWSEVSRHANQLDIISGYYYINQNIDHAANHAQPPQNSMYINDGKD